MSTVEYNISLQISYATGTPGNSTREKTIIIVGPTASGKRTLINYMANYVMGVTWEDPFRFTLVHYDEERVGNEVGQEITKHFCRQNSFYIFLFLFYISFNKRLIFFTI